MRRTLSVLVLALCFAVPAGAADVRRVDALGAAPMAGEGRSRGSPRDEALRRALQEAVWRIAIEQLASAGAMPEDAVVSGALGNDPLVYATRFQIVEDRGERPALFSDDPEIGSAYVVLAEVYVDVDRVRRQLSGAGLMGAPSGDAGGRFQTRVTLVDVQRWAEIQAVRTLLGEIGAESAVPIELVRGRAVLAVESRHSAAELMVALRAVAPPELRLELLGAGPDGLELRARFLENSGSSSPARSSRFDTTGAKGY